MKAQHKNNPSLILEVVHWNAKVFTGRALESNTAWKKGEIGRSFAISDFNIIHDMDSFLKISEQLNQIVKLTF